MNRFDAHRAHLFAVAYRMLGSAADAEDVLQDAWVRAREAAAGPRDERAFLTTVVTRLCLDRLKASRAKREAYVGPWLPEPIPTDPAAAPPSASDRIGVAESVTMAVLVILERLSPLERAAFLLHEVFELSFAEVAEALARSEDACRQLHHRARRHVASERPRFSPPEDGGRRLAGAFLSAAWSGDVDGLKALLAEDAVAVSDGGGLVGIARRVVTGADRVARFVAGVAGKAQRAGIAPEASWLNGSPALVMRRPDGRIHLALVVDCGADRVRALRIVVNPEKLGMLRRAAAAVLS